MKQKDQAPRGNWAEEGDNLWDAKQNWIDEAEPEESPHGQWIEEGVEQ